MTRIPAVIVLLSMLVGCGSAPVGPTPTRTARAVTLTLAASPTVDPVERLMGTSTQLAATHIAATQTTATPTPLPDGPLTGWAWYEAEGLRFAYPVSWTVEVNKYGSGEIRFISPETFTEIWVRPDHGFAYTDLGWLDYLRAEQNRRRVIGNIPADAIQPNAVIQGREAFFYFMPVNPGLGDTAVLLFPDGEKLHRFYLHAGAAIPPLDAEARVFQAMLSSIRFMGERARASDIPTGWEAGESLIRFSAASQAGAELITVSGEITQAYDWWTDGFVLRADDGETYTVSLPSLAALAGQPLDYFPTAAGGRLDADLQAGNTVQVVGTRHASGEIMPYAINLQEGDAWETGHYREFYDVSLTPALGEIMAEALPTGDDYPLWLYGPAEDVLPYLRDAQAGEGVSLAAMGLQPDDTILAKGLLLTAEPKLQLAELYIHRGECRTITLVDPISGEATRSYDECLNWLPLYPPPQPVAFTARVLYAVPDQGVIVLREPVQGFIAVTLLDSDALIGQNGEPAAWDELTGDIWIDVTGELGDAGTLLADRVEIRPFGP